MQSKELENFMGSVDVRKPNECWPWKGYIDHNLGYGRTSFHGSSGVFPASAHRVLWTLVHGEIPKYINGRKALIRHKCGNKLCLNPDHLILGTYSENAWDCSAEGKHVRLTIDDLQKAIKLRKEGNTYRKIGKLLGVSETVVSGALRGKHHCYRQMLEVLSSTNLIQRKEQAMKQLEVSATVPKKEGEKGREEDKSATIYVNYPESIEEAKQMFGEEAILSNAFANWRVTLQAGIRRSILAGKTPEQIAAEFKDAKMGVAVQGAKMDPLQASLLKFKTMTKEEQAAFLKDLKAAAQG